MCWKRCLCVRHECRCFAELARDYRSFLPAYQDIERLDARATHQQRIDFQRAELWTACAGQGPDARDNLADCLQAHAPPTTRPTRPGCARTFPQPPLTCA